MFQVLMAVDTSEQRVQTQVEWVSRLPDADSSVTVHILHVISDEGSQSLRNKKQPMKVEAVQTAHQKLKEAGISVELVGEATSSTRDVIHKAENIDADAIVFAGRHRSPAGKVRFGSLTQDVALSTDRAVLIVGNE
jgi:nucleotide-binding universal stress UspA family protein